MEPSPYGQYDAPPPASAPSGGAPAAPAGRPRARIGLIVLTALLSEIVLIAAGANQWSAKQMAKADGQVRYYLLGWLTYSWRVTAPHGATKTWAAQFALIGTVLVLTAALVWCLLRGPVTWGRAFFGTWLAVLFATVAGSVVRGLVQPMATIPGNSRVTAAFFGFNGPSSGPVFAGLVLGLVVGTITGVIAVVSRRPAADAVPAETGPPQFADYGPPMAAAPAHLPPWQDQQFTQHPGGPSYAPARPVGPPAGSGPPPAAPAEGDAATTALPRLGDGGPAAEPARPEQPARTEQPAGTEEPARSAQPATDEPTTQLPVEPAAAGPGPAEEHPPVREPGTAEPPTDQPTTQMPAGPPEQPGEQATTRFPRPPDDEELGHIEP